ncbi:dihydrodipicolinate synthase family protein [Spirosoma telluris]|uniref:dihydrodipicolinate synthase family protein n=1 Tax=Spirosoma telluris TaxID=2183553 RepID=UPI002FC382DB
MIHTDNELFGVVPIIPTPFTENEEIDEDALRSLIDFAIDGGIKAVCLPAYASEFYKLTDDEKLQVVRVAVERAAGRLKIVAQSNHPSLKVAIKLAQANVQAGADVISLAVPRIFSLPENSLKAYLSEFLQSIPNTPVLIQDFNPGGSSISVGFIKELMDENPNFKYLKLEEPLCAPKFEQIIQATNDKIGLFEGWGGLYMLELVPIGIRGSCRDWPWPTFCKGFSPCVPVEKMPKRSSCSSGSCRRYSSRCKTWSYSIMPRKNC